MMLRPHAATALPSLVKEAASLFPANLAALDDWQPPWYRRGAAAEGARRAPASEAAVTSKPGLDPSQQAAAELLAAYPATTDALAVALGLPAVWSERPGTLAIGPDSIPSGACDPVRALLRAFPATLDATTDLLGTTRRPGSGC
jgi:hypothetical protein